jgi:hypothetical protein
MKFKILKGNPLFDGLAEIREQIKVAYIANKALAAEYGSDGVASHNHYLAGGIKAFHFQSGELPFPNWKPMERGYTNWYMPKSPKNKRDPLHEVWAKINALPKVDDKGLQELLQYSIGLSGDGNAISIFSRPGVSWHEDYILVKFPDGANYKPVEHMIEITDSEFKELAGQKLLEFE